VSIRKKAKADDIRHFVAYHNAEKFGRYRSAEGASREHTFWTAKAFRDETLLGQRLWAFEGVGSPKRYSLVAAGTITKIARKKGGSNERVVHFEVASKTQPIEVTDLGWFKKLLIEQQSFRNGLSRTKSHGAIIALEALVAPERPPRLAKSKASAEPLESIDVRFAKLVEASHSKEVLRMLGHSIEVADRADQSKWGIRINDNSIMLKVGFVEVLQVGRRGIHLLVKGGLDTRALRADARIDFSRAPYKNAQNCDTCDFDVASLKSLYQRLKEAHDAAIRVAALSPRHTSTANDHSEMLVEFLSECLGRRLPQPAYVGTISLQRVSQKDNLTSNDLQEGRAIQVLANRYERNPKARARCIDHYGTDCFVCGLSFADQYGPDVAGLIHIHHLTPISRIGRRSSVDPIRDLRPVCPNCHAVIHWTDPHQSIEQIKEKLQRWGDAKRSNTLRASYPQSRRSGK
jgi:hypothetical protein